MSAAQQFGKRRKLTVKATAAITVAGRATLPKADLNALLALGPASGMPIPSPGHILPGAEESHAAELERDQSSGPPLLARVGIQVPHAKKVSRLGEHLDMGCHVVISIAVGVEPDPPPLQKSFASV